MAKDKDLETKGISVMMVLEIIGRPPEHLTETLEKLISEMDKEAGTSVKSKTIKEPVVMEKAKEFYTTFAEVEIEVEELANLLILIFKYMPAHVEILNPELIALTNNGWNDILNELTRRLHGYDEVARVLQHQNAQMKKKLEELMPSEKNKEASKEKTPKKK